MIKIQQTNMQALQEEHKNLIKVLLIISRQEAPMYACVEPTVQHV
jgi:hypothetical protein